MNRQDFIQDANDYLKKGEYILAFNAVVEGVSLDDPEQPLTFVDMQAYDYLLTSIIYQIKDDKYQDRVKRFRSLFDFVIARDALEVD